MKAAIDCKIVATRSSFQVRTTAQGDQNAIVTSHFPARHPFGAPRQLSRVPLLFHPPCFHRVPLQPASAQIRPGKRLPDPNCLFLLPPPPAPPARGARGPVQRQSERLCFLPRSAAEPRRTVRQGSFISLRGFSSSCTLGDLRSCVSAKRRRHTVCGVRPQYCVRRDAQSARLGHAHVSC